MSRRSLALPLPPLALRQLAGPIDDSEYDNPSGDPVYSYLDTSCYASVLDFGCGCGRIARQLIQQRDRPDRYLGIDLHRGLIRWCRSNLREDGFEFRHHDVFNYSFNPDPTRPSVLPFPAEDGAFTLVNAHSVFTHLTQSQAGYYLDEVARVLRPGGYLNSTWFLFDKREFPMLQDDHNALYVSDLDPCAAVLFDRQWVRRRARDAGLAIVGVQKPAVRGYQWVLVMAHALEGVREVALPEDTAALGFVQLPPLLDSPSELGLGREG